MIFIPNQKGSNGHVNLAELRAERHRHYCTPTSQTNQNTRTHIHTSQYMFPAKVHRITVTDDKRLPRAFSTSSSISSSDKKFLHASAHGVHVAL